MCSTAYKKQGAPDRRSITQQKLMLFTCVAQHRKSKEAPDQRSTHLLLLSARVLPRIKSNGLHRYVFQICYFINQVFKSFCSSASIIIDGLALLQTSRVRLLVFIGTRWNE
jgi:hypothetical protein